MKIINTFLVKYEKSQENNSLAILIETATSYYIKYLAYDGTGWSERIEKIANEEAQELII